MKIIKVHDCVTCPYYILRLLKQVPSMRIAALPEQDWCSYSGRYFEVLDTIPGWCLLEDLTFFIGTDDAYISNKGIRSCVCICKTTCPNGCHGECGCRVCRDNYEGGYMTIQDLIKKLNELDDSISGSLPVAISDWSEGHAPPTLDIQLKRTKFIATRIDGKDIDVDGVVLTSDYDVKDKP